MSFLRGLFAQYADATCYEHCLSVFWLTLRHVRHVESSSRTFALALGMEALGDDKRVLFIRAQILSKQSSVISN